ARPIPGNEGAIWRTINRLFEQGCRVIYDAPTPIHVSGHAYQEELKMMVNLTRPYYIAPVHGEPRHQFLYSQIAGDMGYPDHRIFTLKNGVPLEIGETSAEFGTPVPAGQVLVDAGGNLGVSDEVLRDRSNAAREGVVVVTVAIDKTRGEIMGRPEVQAKGFSGAEQALEVARDHVYDHLAALSSEERRDVNRVKHDTMDVVRRLLHRRTSLRPLVLPVVIEV
ncbi:MAG: ribonuclease J, partial [Brevundimonas sp.]